MTKTYCDICAGEIAHGEFEYKSRVVIDIPSHQENYTKVRLNLCKKDMQELKEKYYNIFEKTM